VENVMAVSKAAEKATPTEQSEPAFLSPCLTNCDIATISNNTNTTARIPQHCNDAILGEVNDEMRVCI